MVLCIMHGYGAKGVSIYANLTPSLMQIDQLLEEEIKTGPSELNLLAYLRAVREKQVRGVSIGLMKVKCTLTLKKYVQLAFINSNEVKQVRQQMLAVGGSKLINNSRGLPTIDSTTRRFLVNFRVHYQEILREVFSEAYPILTTRSLLNKPCNAKWSKTVMKCAVR